MDTIEAGTCQICTFMFDSESHLPLILLCGHTFCKECLKNSTSKLRHARLQYNSNPNDRNGHALEESKMCPMRCVNAINKDYVDELTINKSVLDTIKVFNL
jgi:RING-type zinc-finger